MPRVPAHRHGTQTQTQHQTANNSRANKAGTSPMIIPSPSLLSSPSTDTGRTRQQAYPCTYQHNSTPQQLPSRHNICLPLPKTLETGTVQSGLIHKVLACLAPKQKRLKRRIVTAAPSDAQDQNAKKKGQKEKRTSFHIMVMIHHLIVIHRRSSVVGRPVNNTPTSTSLPTSIIHTIPPSIHQRNKSSSNSLHKVMSSYHPH